MVNAYKPTPRQHTPGPWEVSKIGNNYEQYSIYAGDAIVANSVDGEANARLIAAAPDLLGALKNLVRDAEDREETRNSKGKLYDDFKWAYEAIAKAEGK